MPWHNGNYPSLYQNQPVRLRQKAVEIANHLLRNGVDETTAIHTGLCKAREYFLYQIPHKKIDTELPAFP
jgi:uncharacterized protein YdaT